MNLLKIGEEERATIAKVVAYAEKNRFSKPLMMERLRGKGVIPGDMEAFKCYIPNGYRCVFTIEEHPMGWAKHLSVSIADKKKKPHPAAVQMIMKEFGITQALEDCYIYFEEEISHISKPAFPNGVNIVAKI